MVPAHGDQGLSSAYLEASAAIDACTTNAEIMALIRPALSDPGRNMSEMIVETRQVSGNSDGRRNGANIESRGGRRMQNATELSPVHKSQPQSRGSRLSKMLGKGNTTQKQGEQTREQGRSGLKRLSHMLSLRR